VQRGEARVLALALVVIVTIIVAIAVTIATVATVAVVSSRFALALGAMATAGPG
jgi:hypothetical protein